MRSPICTSKDENITNKWKGRPYRQYTHLDAAVIFYLYGENSA